jgi:hypothetical protein
MTAPTTNETFDERFIEIVELLLEQQIAAEDRSDKANRQQLDMLDQLQTQLTRLSMRFESMGHLPAAPSEGSKSQSSDSAKNTTSGMSEWERQKQLIMQGMDPNEAIQMPPPAEEPKEAVADLPASSESAPAETTSHDWIEHLDPSDPALADDQARRELVARLRKLEVELSLQRAKLARERTELDEQFAELKRLQRQQAVEPVDSDEPGRPTAGRVDRVLRFLGRKKE